MHLPQVPPQEAESRPAETLRFKALALKDAAVAPAPTEALFVLKPKGKRRDTANAHKRHKGTKDKPGKKHVWLVLTAAFNGTEEKKGSPAELPSPPELPDT